MSLKSTILSLLPTALLLTSSTTAAPLAPRAGCPGATTSFSFDVKNFDYHDGTTFSTPAHQIPGGFVAFNLTSAADVVPRQCNAYSTQLSDFYYGTLNYTCTTTTADGEVVQTGSLFTYDTPGETLVLVEPFECDGQKYVAKGTYTFEPPLQCVTEEYQNDDWQQGEIYSSRKRTCEERDFAFFAEVEKVE
ncbi:hypothetical protein EJ05DRAFT_206464 [Pseudovirgaria hyperparasitica]|uniref:AA1-like domain-containing protein n=1 Tax=Pseudovirgaria hyperparasitica TaxID=470096 RepID=A0A6A6WJC8_9PEZI|nr:uncharacterized protein EJ05DRAFT_206464 [Pseudovirgaria hyperparasitica]KAF2762344.1 hypothetical protein EJ05DRAFT_206464 [Pseudovirgaria hyperparasitica]